MSDKTGISVNGDVEKFLPQLALAREGRWFDPDSLVLGMQRDLPGTLRLLADAIERGELEGSRPVTLPIGLGREADDRARLRVSFWVAGQIRTETEGAR